MIIVVEIVTLLFTANVSVELFFLFCCNLRLLFGEVKSKTYLKINKIINNKFIVLSDTM